MKSIGTFLLYYSFQPLIRAIRCIKIKTLLYNSYLKQKMPRSNKNTSPAVIQKPKSVSVMHTRPSLSLDSM